MQVSAGSQEEKPAAMEIVSATVSFLCVYANIFSSWLGLLCVLNLTVRGVSVKFERRIITIMRGVYTFTPTLFL